MILSYLALTSAFLMLLSGGLGIALDSRARLNRIFFALSLVSAFWAFCYVFIYALTPDQAWFWYRIASFGWCTAIPLMFLFSLSFAGQDQTIPRGITILTAAWVCLLVGIQLTGTLFVVGFVPTAWGNAEITDIGRPAFLLFLVPSLILIVGGWYQFFRGQRHGKSKYVRRRSGYILTLALAIYPAGFTLNICGSLAFGKPIPALGIFPLAVFLAVSVLLMYRFSPPTLKNLQISLIDALDDRFILLSTEKRILRTNRLLPAYPMETDLKDMIKDFDSLSDCLDLAAKDRKVQHLRTEWIDNKESVSVQITISPLYDRDADLEGYALMIRNLPDFDLVADQYGLSPQERLLVRHSLRGLTLKEIAEIMGLSPGTVKNYLATVYKKTESRSQVDLVRKFLAQL